MTKASKVEAGNPLELLRVPFDPHHISKLPKETRKQIDERNNDRSKMVWGCKECGGYHHKDAVHLDYVGHAALTDRLLDTDIEWSWEPAGFDERGLPALDHTGGLWIKLTVAGVTRYGYGAADGKQGGDAMKEKIGDALRNAAMRFGAALDLWHKGDLHPDMADDDGSAATRAVTNAPRQETAKPKGNSIGAQQQPGDPTASEFRAMLREVHRNILSCGDPDELDLYLATDDAKTVIDNCQRRAPHWWEYTAETPPDFKPLMVVIDDHRRDLKANEKQPITAAG